jgi:NAD(P)-dependent dehydrogenase (short-subunit alcohol dehydrogenase family)
MTRALAKDWGSSGIRVNNICPGYIKTSMTQKSFDDPELYEVRRNKSVLGRWGNSEDLVGPSIFLLSDASSFITGSDIYVDGGWTSNAGI